MEVEAGEAVTSVHFGSLAVPLRPRLETKQSALQVILRFADTEGSEGQRSKEMDADEGEVKEWWETVRGTRDRSLSLTTVRLLRSLKKLSATQHKKGR